MHHKKYMKKDSLLKWEEVVKELDDEIEGGVGMDWDDEFDFEMTL